MIDIFLIGLINYPMRCILTCIFYILLSCELLNIYFLLLAKNVFSSSDILWYVSYLNNLRETSFQQITRTRV